MERDPERVYKTDHWLENVNAQSTVVRDKMLMRVMQRSRSMPPEIKRSKVLNSHWGSVKFFAWLVDDMKAAPIIGLGLGDAVATVMLTILTFYNYNTFLKALDRQMKLDCAEDPEAYKRYKRIVKRHDNGIKQALFLKFTIGCIPVIGDYIAMLKFKPASVASENIGKIVIELYWYDDGVEKRKFYDVRMPSRPGRVYQQTGYAQSQGGIAYSKSQRSAGRSTTSSKHSRKRRR